MTSREKLLKLRSDFYKQDPVDYDSIAYFTTIERDLEILDLLKKHSSIIEIYSNVDKLGERFVCEISFNDKQDVEKLKEWLNHE